MPLRTALLFFLALASTASAQVHPDTLRAPADSLISYGWSVDADEERLLVGARLFPPPAAQLQSDPEGVVFVYRQDADGAWVVEGRLDSDDVSHQDCFSWSLDLRGDLAAVGAECEYGPNPDGTSRQGAVYLYRYDGTAWAREAKLYPSDVTGAVAPGPRFGESVSLGADYLVVGAGGSPNPANPDEDYSSGAAFVFEQQDGAWQHTATLVNDDADALLNEYFGGTVAAAGDEILVGAPSEDTPGTVNRGAVYVFGQAGGAWTQRAKLTAPTPSAGEFFGSLLAADDTGAVIGAGGSPFVYRAEENAGAWEVLPYPPLENHAYAVACSGAHVLAHDVEQGYLFDRHALAMPPVILPLTYFNQSTEELVSLNSRYAFIGHPDSDASGYVLVYDLDSLMTTVPDAPTPPALALAAAPNPAAGDVRVRFVLPQAGPVSLAVYDALGREVRRLVQGTRSAGTHEAALDGQALAPGVYLVRLVTEEGTATRTVTLTR